MDQQNDQFAQAAAKVFQQTQTFQDKFAELTRMLESIERKGQATARSLEPPHSSSSNWSNSLIRSSRCVRFRVSSRNWRKPSNR
jgi:hypothetical protein